MLHKTPTLLVILDGVGLTGTPENDSLQPGRPAGLRGPEDRDAVRAAHTPFLDRLRREGSFAILSASGPDAGLPDGQPGDSEAGWLNIGAGRIARQDLDRVSRALSDGTFFQNPAFTRAMDNCREHGSALHLAGVLSDTGRYARLEHLFTLLRMAKEQNLSPVYLHPFLEGDNPRVCEDLLRRTLNFCAELGVGTVSTLMGLSCAAGIGGHDPLELAYDAMVYGESATGTASAAPETVLRERRADAQLEPVVCIPDGTVSDNDSLIFWDFRPASALPRAFLDPRFDAFTRQLFPLVCVTVTDYGVPGAIPAFPPETLPNNLGEYLSGLGLTQLRIADPGCARQAGFWFNGRVLNPFPGEERVLVPNPGARSVLSADIGARSAASVDTFPDIGAECVRRMEAGTFDLVVLGLSACAAAARTGSVEQTVRAMEAADSSIGTAVEAALKMGGIAMITGSCGGAEEVRRAAPGEGGSVNPVPFLLCGAGSRLRPGRLSDIAPTLLDVMGLASPPEMDGNTLIVE